jgi:hypothetical protein
MSKRRQAGGLAGGRSMTDFLDDYDCESLDRVRNLIGEHFRYFSFAVITHDGSFYYDFSNQIVGEALLNKAMAEIQEFGEDPEIIFEGDEWKELEEDGDEVD